MVNTIKLLSSIVYTLLLLLLLADNDPYYIKAIAEGSGYLRPAVVIMHEPPGAGKTSVKQLFLGREPLPPEKQNSTG